MRTPTLLPLSLVLACATSHPSAPSTPRATVTPPNDVLSVAPASVPEVLASGRLPALARPRSYALELSLDPARPEYRGAVRIELDVPSPTRVIVLNSRGQSIDSATLSFGGSTLAAHTTARMAHGGREHTEELVVTLDREIPAGRAALSLAFHAPYDNGLRGVFRVRVGDDWYAYSDFEPNDARRAFPCFDEPALKARFQVTVTAPRGSVAIQNMPESSHTVNPDGSTSYRFAETPPISSYLLAFAVGPFDFFQGPQSPVPLRVVTPRGRAALGSLIAEAAAAHLTLLSEYFDRPYPYPKLDLVSVADFGPGAMENPGLITFRDSLILLDPVHSSSRARLSMASVTAHELAHQWFGDLVTMEWWDDLWLNEGFATWMSTVVMDRWRPALGVRIDTVHGRSWARELDSRPSAHAIRREVTSTSEAMEAFDSITYDKGAAILAMIESWMTPERFRSGVRAYIRAHAEGNATAADLLSALTEAGGREIPRIAASFLDQPGIPRIEMRLQCPAGHAAVVSLRQSRFAPYGAQEGNTSQTWTLPVCLRYPTATGPREYCTLLSTPERDLELEGSTCPAWISPNAQHTGHYFYDLRPELFRALWTHREALDPAGRIELLGNLESLLRGAVITADLYLQALSALLSDTDPHVLQAAIGSLSLVESTLVTDASRPAFRRWVASRVGPLARRLGVTPAATEDDLHRGLRRAALDTLGMLSDDPWVLSESNRLAAQYLRDPESLDADVASVALNVSSRHGTAARFDALTAAVAASPTPQRRNIALAALMSIEDPEIYTRALNLALAESTHQQDLRVLLGRRGHTPAMRSLAARWTLENFSALLRRWNNNGRALGGQLAGLCEASRIDAAEAVINPLIARMEGAARPFRGIFEASRRCVETHGREASRTEVFFQHPR